MSVAVEQLGQGVHPNVPFEVYCTDPGVNASTLKHFHRSTPKHAKFAMDQPDTDTKALRRGHATHTAVLEPKLFNTLYAKFPKAEMLQAHGGPNRSPNCNAYKTARDVWYAEHEDACILDDAEWDNALAIRDAIIEGDNAIARQLLFEGAGKNELTIIDESEGLRRKARVDRLTYYEKHPCIVDLKTIETRGYPLNHRTAELQINQYAYHVQLAWYLDLLNSAKPADRLAIIVFVEAEPPHDVVCYHVDTPTIEHGRKLAAKYLNQLKRGRETGYWPGFSNHLLSFNFHDRILEEEGNL